MNLQYAEEHMLAKFIAGSHAYGTNTETSDVDHRGIFYIPPVDYWKVNKPIEQVSDAKNDTTYYTVLRFLELASHGNPNILEMLWMPEDCELVVTDAFKHIKEIRSTFITKSVLDSFAGYAYAQIKKAKGQNKLINNPMPETKPTKEDFCWTIPCRPNTTSRFSLQEQWLGNEINKQGESFGKPIPLKESVEYDSNLEFRLKVYGKQYEPTYIRLHNYHAAKVEHANNLYRLYYYGDEAKGVFRGDESADIVCESIPLEDESSRFHGLLMYHKDAYEKALRDWHQYWDWRKNRNEARWVDQENKAVSFDQKNMAHCIRLMYSAQNIIEHGEPIVRFTGDKLQKIKDIRACKYSYEELLAEAEEGIAKVDAFRKTCSLPSTPAYNVINAVSAMIHWELMNGK